MPMDATYLQLLVSELKSRNIVFAEGLSDNEVLQIELTYEFKFPPDLRALLQFALPISEWFPNWRRGWIAIPIVEWHEGTSVIQGHNLVPIKDHLAWPTEGVCFDIERNDFWSAGWGKDLRTSRLR
jgi:hypothetical protein